MLVDDRDGVARRALARGARFPDQEVNVEAQLWALDFLTQTASDEESIAVIETSEGDVEGAYRALLALVDDPEA